MNQPEVELKSVSKWRRFMLRANERALWHVHGILLWLLRRPFLRCLPLPYPAVGTVKDWDKQMSQMLEAGAISKRCAQKIKADKLMTSEALRDCCWLRDRLGLRVAFMEDPILPGLLAARGVKGLANQNQGSGGSRRERESSSDPGERPAFECSSGTDRSPRWPPSSSWRFGQVGRTFAAQRAGQEPHRRAEDSHQARRPDLGGIHGQARFPQQFKPTNSKASTQSQGTSKGLASTGARSSTSSTRSSTGHACHVGRAEQSLPRDDVSTDAGWSNHARLGLRRRSASASVGRLRVAGGSVVGIRKHDASPSRLDGTGSGRGYGRGGEFLSLRSAQDQHSQALEDNPWRIHQGLKKGQTLMISQAWEQHCRDRERISKSPKEVLQVMHQEWNRSMQSCLNEPFVMKIDITPEVPEAIEYKEALDTKTVSADKVTQPLVGEIYTGTEQIAKQAQLRGHRTSASMSLENGWDFRRADHRKACIRKVLEEDPFCLVLAFPCGPWSPLTRLRASSTLDERRKEGEVLLDFALILARIQLRRGCHFLIENPKGSMAWALPQMLRFLEETGCAVVDFDQCRFRLKSLRGFLHKKPTRIATSSAAVADGLRDCLCPGDHPHDPVIGGSKITSRAGHYPVSLARNIVKSLEKQFHLQHVHGREVHAVDGEEVAEDDAAMEAFGSDSDISSIADEDEDEEKSLRIPAATRAAVKRLHESTGHRSNRRLARALVIAGAPKEVVTAAKHLRCSLCDEKKRPKSRRPATLPTPKDVSDQVHIDVVEMFDIEDKRFYVVHCIDWTSRFQMAEALEHKSSEAIAKWFRERWLPIFGAPRVLVADQGREFVSWEFQETM